MLPILNSRRFNTYRCPPCCRRSRVIRKDASRALASSLLRTSTAWKGPSERCVACCVRHIIQEGQPASVHLTNRGAVFKRTTTAAVPGSSSAGSNTIPTLSAVHQKIIYVFHIAWYVKGALQLLCRLGCSVGVGWRQAGQHAGQGCPLVAANC